MATESGSTPNLVELYGRYNRQDTFAALGMGAGTVVTLGTAVLLATNMPSGFYEWVGDTLRARPEAFEQTLINMSKATGVFTAEAGIGFLWSKLYSNTRHGLAIQIAQAEGRVPDETNENRIMWTSALASTLVYGVEFRPSFFNNLVNTFVRPIWDMRIQFTELEEKVAVTFESFDAGLKSLPVQDWQRDGIAVPALNLGRARWELIRNGQGSSRLRGYSFAMLSEINRRLGEPLS